MAVSDAPGVAELVGLTAAEVADRRRRGLTNDLPTSPTRTVGEIVRANVVTYFNFLLGTLFVLILIFGESNDALFGGVIIANTVIGIVQEVRAKRTLDRLAVLTTPKARVLRDGTAAEVAVNEVVLDDVLLLQPGDQVVVDGEVRAAAGLEVDESLLTGESDPVLKAAGDHMMSGSFVAAGSGAMVATKVGREAYAAQVAEEARKFTLSSSELRQGVDRIIRWCSYLMVPTAGLLLWSQFSRNTSIGTKIAGSVAGVVAMVPEGLVLLTSIAFAVSVVRLAQRKVLVQELPAVETLARVDVVCLDKTGTLTTGNLVLGHIDAQPGADEATVRDALTALAASDPNPNATLRAIGVGLDSGGDGGTLPAAPAGWVAGSTVPFSSARKWSAASFDGHGSWVLGAPDRVLPHDTDVLAGVEAQAAEGRRVVLLAHTDASVDGEALPDGLRAAALVSLEDKVRPEAPQTLRYFDKQGVIVKVISGDHPDTVGAVARRAGLDAGDAVDAATLPDDPEALAEVMDRTTVFGRVTPQQKREMVGALHLRGHTVAMTGDGVNDVLALKDADIGIAMGSGAAATRAAAQLVLIDGNWASLPGVVAEGRRVINNIGRVANLYLTKTTYAMFLALAVGVLRWEYPFLPRHLTLVGSLAIGIPSFFLALAPNNRRALPHFVARVLRFAIPCGLVCGGCTLVAYALARNYPGLTVTEWRTTATLVLVTLSLVVLAQLARPFEPWRIALVLAMALGFVLVMAVPFGREFFDLAMPPAGMRVQAAIVAGVGTALLVAGFITVPWLREQGQEPGQTDQALDGEQSDSAEDPHDQSGSPRFSEV